jgi:hypothetical protein
MLPSRANNHVEAISGERAKTFLLGVYFRLAIYECKNVNEGGSLVRNRSYFGIEGPVLT